jgi:hypothetical protein
VSARIVCDVHPSHHRFDIAVVELVEPSQVDLEILQGAFFNAPEGSEEEEALAAARDCVADRLGTDVEVHTDTVIAVYLQETRHDGKWGADGVYRGPLVVYERCAVHGEGGIWAREGGERALRSMIQRYGLGGLLRIYTKTDSERDTHVDVRASRVVVLRHYAPGEV